VQRVGEYIFRPFPADHLGSKLLYHHMKTRFKRVGILTEDEEYATLLERAFRQESEREGIVSVVYEQSPRGGKDFRTILLRLLAKKPEAIFLNPAGEAGFIPLIKQVRALKVNLPLFAEYMPGSSVVLKEVKREVEGMVFADLPSAADIGTGKGAEILRAMDARFGPSRSVSLLRSLGYTSFQLLDQAVRSNSDVQKFLKNRSFTSELLGDVSFTPENTLRGIEFTLKQIKNGVPVTFNTFPKGEEPAPSK
jgi:ABC-type branched-subunit amino acid transport system substrate-binding protein